MAVRKAVLTSVVTGMSWPVRAIETNIGTTVDMVHFSAFGDEVKTSLPNGCPQIKPWTIKVLDEGGTSQLEKAGAKATISVTTTLSDGSTTGTRTISSVVGHIQETTPASVESDGNRIGDVDIIFQPVGGTWANAGLGTT